MTHYAEIVSGLGLGLLTSVYPCTMATNLTAMSWLASSAHDVRRTVLSGITYAAGRAFTYTVLGLLLSKAAVSAVRTADTLQYYAGQLLGPLLVLTGMFVSGLLGSGSSVSLKLADRLKPRLRGAAGGFVMGALLALAFCPASAAIFFGSVVMGLASGAVAMFAVPAAFGIGTAIPVLILSIVFARGLESLQAKLRYARWFRRHLPAFFGGLLILLGIYLSFRDIILA